MALTGFESGHPRFRTYSNEQGLPISLIYTIHCKVCGSTSIEMKHFTKSLHAHRANQVLDSTHRDVCLTCIDWGSNVRHP